jgi:hypothetical protein
MPIMRRKAYCRFPDLVKVVSEKLNSYNDLFSHYEETLTERDAWNQHNWGTGEITGLVH